MTLADGNYTRSATPCFDLRQAGSSPAFQLPFFLSFRPLCADRRRELPVKKLKGNAGVQVARRATSPNCEDPSAELEAMRTARRRWRVASAEAVDCEGGENTSSAERVSLS